jgi:cellulose synthase/poly-beta-1,6-N-acetylglucosamine synthase-like glycosyltransferase
MIETVFVISFMLVAYIYVLYPLLLLLVSRFQGLRDVPALQPDQDPSITIVVAAFNEQSVIEQKIRNLMALDSPRESYQVLVTSDASDDATDAIVATLVDEFGADRLQLLANPQRRGKTGAINSAMQQVTTELTVFTDANVLLAKDTLTQVRDAFAHPKVGGVAGHLLTTNPHTNQATRSSSLYWRYEEFIKAAESRTGSTMGADGGIFAIRTELFSPLPEYVLDDFCTSMGVIFRGYRLVYCPEVVGQEKVAEQSAEEFSRKVRIANRSYNSFRFLRPSLRKMRAPDQWKFLSHKLLRWYTTPLLFLCLVSNFAWVFSGDAPWAVGLFLLTQVAAYTLATLSWRGLLKGPQVLQHVGGAAHYFCLANIATFLGILQSYRGQRTAFWSSATSGR